MDVPQIPLGLSDRTLNIPSSVNITEDQIDSVVEALSSGVSGSDGGD